MTQNSSSLRGITFIMLWLFTVTVMMVVLPWQRISPEIASRIQDNREFLYFALMIEVSHLLCQMIYSSFSRKNAIKAKQSREASVEQAVNALDFSERAVLREYVLQRKSVLNLPVDEPTVRSLMRSGILRMAGAEGEDGKTPLVISKTARPYITYKAIGLSCGKMSAEQISQIMEARPEFAREPKPMPKAYRASGTFMARAA